MCLSILSGNANINETAEIDIEKETKDGESKDPIVPGKINKLFW